MKTEEFKAGDKVVLVLRSFRNNVEPTLYDDEITKVGRDWYTLASKSGERRVNIKTLQIDGKGYSSPGYIVRDVAEYEAERKLSKAWNEVHQYIRNLYSVPAFLTQEDIETLSTMFKMDERK